MGRSRTTPAMFAPSSASRASASLSGLVSGRILYIGIPIAPRAVSSLASRSSATRRADSLSIIATATTFAPWIRSGAAPGALHDDTKLVDEHASRDVASRATLQNLVRIMFLAPSAAPTGHESRLQHPFQGSWSARQARLLGSTASRATRSAGEKP